MISCTTTDSQYNVVSCTVAIPEAVQPLLSTTDNVYSAEGNKMNVPVKLLCELPFSSMEYVNGDVPPVRIFISNSPLETPQVVVSSSASIVNPSEDPIVALPTSVQTETEAS